MFHYSSEISSREVSKHNNTARPHVTRPSGAQGHVEVSPYIAICASRDKMLKNAFMKLLQNVTRWTIIVVCCNPSLVATFCFSTLFRCGCLLGMSRCQESCISRSTSAISAFFGWSYLKVTSISQFLWCHSLLQDSASISKYFGIRRGPINYFDNFDFHWVCSHLARTRNSICNAINLSHFELLSEEFLKLCKFGAYVKLVGSEIQFGATLIW